MRNRKLMGLLWLGFSLTGCFMLSGPPFAPAPAIAADYVMLRDAKSFDQLCSGFPSLTLKLSEQTVSYRALLSHPEGDRHFKELLGSAGLPAQLYGLAGLYFTDRKQFGDAIIPYLESSEPVHLPSGNVFVARTIREVAEELSIGDTSRRLREGTCSRSVS